MNGKHLMSSSIRCTVPAAFVGAVLASPLALAAPPANDSCADASDVIEGDTPFDTTEATNDGGIAPCGFGPAHRDVWFRYTAACTGDLSISLCGSAFDTVLSVYDCSVACPTQLGEQMICDDDGCAPGGASQVSMPIASGTCLLLRVSGFDAGDAGAGLMSIVCTPPPPPPANDNCVDSIPILNGETFASIASATTDGASTSCGQVFDDVWFDYTATCTGSIVVSGQVEYEWGSSQARMAVYANCGAGACPTTTPLKCGTGSLLMDVVAGTCYKFRAGAFFADSQGTVRINIGCYDDQANDSCAGRMPAMTGDTPYDNVSATTDGLDTACGQILEDVWFNYIATCTGQVKVSAVPSASSYITPRIAVYDGCDTLNCPPATELACGTGSLYMQMTAGNCYKIRIGSSFSGFPKPGTLTIECTTPPVNDACANSLPISIGTTPFDNSGADTDGEPTACGQIFGDLWFDYTATCTGFLQISATLPGTPGNLAAYAACGAGGCPTGSPIACDSFGYGALFIGATAGQCYKIRVGAYSLSGTGAGEIEIQCTPAPPNDMCVNAIPVATGSTVITNVGATSDGPTNTCFQFHNDVWYTWIAPITGTVWIRFSDQDHRAALYADCSGAGCPIGTELACGWAYAPLNYSVVQGECYRIRVGCDFIFQSSAVTMDISVGSTPINDVCEGAIALSDGSTPFNNIGSVIDGDPASCTQLTNDVWFTYTPSCDGEVVIDNVSPFGFVFGMVAYEGGACPPVTELGCSYFYPIVAPAITGQPIALRVGRTFDTDSFSGTLNVQCVPPPANNECSGATPIVEGTNVVTFTGSNASEPAPSCGTLGRDVWFSYVAPCTGIARIWGYDYDLGNGFTFAAYDDCAPVACPPTTELVCSQDGFLTFPTVAGHCYSIRIGTGFATSSRTGQVFVECLPPLVNDDCANRIALSEGTIPFATYFATTDGLGANCTFGQPIDKDIWFTYTPLCDGPLTVSTCGNFDSVIAIYKGCDNASCPPTADAVGCDVASNQEPCSDNRISATVTIEAVAGQCYKIRIGGYFGASGSGLLTLDFNAADSDNDGTPDCNDGCPNDPNKIVPGICGCGVSDADTDNDGTPDCNDGCPSDPNKIAPGACGCGVSDADSDGDGVPNCIDGCPNDPNKIAPGACGCGVAETDTDGDGVPDCVDGCPSDPNKTAPGACGCGATEDDVDADGIPNCIDNCVNIANLDQADNDNDGLGDACDACDNDPDNDIDGDGYCADLDICPTTFNPDQADYDLDGLGDACDNCPFMSNVNQLDGDSDGQGDACETPTGPVVYGLKTRSGAATYVPTPVNLYVFSADGASFIDRGAVTVGGVFANVDAIAQSATLGLFAFEISEAGSRLLSIDAETAHASAVGPLLPGRDIRGACFDTRGNLLAIDAATDQLLVIDSAIGEVACDPVALKVSGSPIDLTFVTDIAARADGTIFVINYTDALSEMRYYTVNPSTGALTQVALDGWVHVGIAFVDGADANTMFAFEATGADDIMSCDSSAVGGFTFTTLIADIISQFNAGPGDLAAIVPVTGTPGCFDPPCPGNIVLDSAVNVSDLLAVISAWGACDAPCPPHCDADIAPLPSGDCAVNVSDLLLVISRWGACP